MIQCKLQCDLVNVGGKNYHPQIFIDFPDIGFEVVDLDRAFSTIGRDHDISLTHEVDDHGREIVTVLIYGDNLSIIDQIKAKGYAVEDVKVI